MTPYELASRYLGIKELAGNAHHPLIQWWLSLCGLGYDSPDETPWCSAFVNGIAWELSLPRSKSAAARSWLLVGRPVDNLWDARAGDVIVLKRGKGEQPGPAIIKAPGHVGFLAGMNGTRIELVGGNQSDGVTLQSFDSTDVLGIRRLSNE